MPSSFYYKPSCKHDNHHHYSKSLPYFYFMLYFSRFHAVIGDIIVELQNALLAGQDVGAD
jgi:hypothetical protein